jgi:hypothetical protein
MAAAPKPPKSPKPGGAPGGARAALAALRQLRASDLRGAAALATQGTLGAARMAEGVHRAVHRSMGLAGGAEPGRTGGITGAVYGAVHGVTRLVGAGVQVGLRALEPFLGREPPESPERAALVAALNGVMGDRLAADGNPLATPLSLRLRGGKPLDPTALPSGASGHILLLAHGLCMNDLQWRRAGHDHGEALAATLGCTPVYLRYNSGLHTWENGRALAEALESLVARWPVPVERLDLLGHSMGGLVLRSALQYGSQAGHAWRARVGHAVFLGTPHHGAPLERAGNWADVLIGSNPWSRPFARLAQLRSSGITDLRFGQVQEGDGQGRARFRAGRDARLALPLPGDVHCHAVAATLAGARSPRAQRMLGDGLVTPPSALGQHTDPARRLHFAAADTLVVHGAGHLDLLSDARVTRQLRQWLRTAPRPAP